MKIFGVALLFAAVSNAQEVPFDEPEAKQDEAKGGDEPEIVEHGTAEKIAESGDKTVKSEDEPAKDEQPEKIEENPAEKKEDDHIEPVEITAEEAEK